MKQTNNLYEQENHTVNENNQAQSYKKTNLFFIKSKHAFRQYKNHDYFEIQKEIVDKSLKHRSRQFVESPPPYGISNAYDYICEEISKNNIRKHNTTQKKFRTLQDRYNDSHRKSQTCQKRKTHFTLPNLEESKKELRQKLFSQKQANRQQSEYKQMQINRRNFTSTAQKTQYTHSLIEKRKKQYFINLIYVDVQQSVSRLHSFQIRLNILNYIINTFLKAKINYAQLTEEQLTFIIPKILQIYETERQYMEYKDLVNFKSTKEIFDFLSTNIGKEITTKQAFRYFFIAKKEVYEYQLNRLKDQIKDRLQFQFQNSEGKDDIYLFEMHSGIQITNLYDLIKYNSNKFIVGVEPNAWTLYQRFTQEQYNKRQLVQRVNNWKSIISDKTHTEMSFKPITVEKYQHLFDGAQKRRAKMNRNRKKCEISLKNSQFIKRQALFKDQNIFQ